MHKQADPWWREGPRPVINEKQIFTEPTVQARLQSGELDAASAYKIQARAVQFTLHNPAQGN
mgnify:CR=1 FL=1